MKNKLIIRVTCLAAALFLVTPDAWAAKGELKSPSIYIGKDFPASAKAKLDAALTRKDCKYLGGTWINMWSSMKYAGDSKALGLFLDELSKVPGIVISVSFIGNKLVVPQDCDWHVGHMANSNRIQISVNMNSEPKKTGDVYLPEIPGPALDK